MANRHSRLVLLILVLLVLGGRTLLTAQTPAASPLPSPQPSVSPTPVPEPKVVAVEGNLELGRSH